MANERLMQLLSMFTGTMQNVGAQRQRGSQFRAGMRMDKARLDFAKERESERMKSDVADRKIRLDELNLRIKESEAAQKITDLTVQREAEKAEFAMVSQPTTETTEQLTQRGAERLREGVGGDAGVLSSLMAFGKNLGPTAQIAAQGPITTPGMTRSEFIAREQTEGVDMAALSGLPEPKEIDYTQMKAAFDMSIMYGVDLPAEFASMPGVVKAIDKGKTAWAKAQTDADKKIALDLAMAEANLEYAQWRAKNPGFGRGGGGGGPSLKTIEEDPVEPMTDDAARSQMSQFTDPPPEGWTDVGILARVNQLEQLEAAYETEGNENMMIYARNIKRQLQDILGGIIKTPRKPMPEYEYKRPPSGAGGRAY